MKTATKANSDTEPPKLSSTSWPDWLEFVGFALIVIAPAIVSGVSSTSPATAHQELYSPAGFLKELLESLRFGLVAAFFLSRHGVRTWRDASGQEILWPKQVLIGIGLWFAYYLLFDLWGALGALAGFKSPSIAWLHPVSGGETALNGVFSLVNGLSEELMRVYLLFQAQRLGLRKAGAALVAAALMTSYHAYQGAWTLLAFMAAHLFFNRLYLAKKPFLALVTWHILADFMHSTDLVGWDVVSSIVNGSVLIAIGAVARLLGHPL